MTINAASRALQYAKDRKIVVIAVGFSAADSLVQGLIAQGARVSLATDAAHAATANALCHSDFSSRAGLALVLQQAMQQLGDIDAVVLAVTPAASLTARPITSMSSDDWQSACLKPLRLVRHGLQEAFGLFAGRPGSVVVLGANLSLTGSAGLTAFSAFSEGQRGLMKSAARQWGSKGIRVNWVGVDSVTLAPPLQDAPIPLSPEMGPPPPAMGYVPTLDNGVAESIAMLVSASALTGVSLPVDGGLWMVP
ncbi:SDR family oxidoreductase [Pseudomonas sp. GB2N2]